MIQSCPHCGRLNSQKLRDTWLMVCAQCHRQAWGSVALKEDLFEMPDDWSLIQIGSTGKYKDKPFEITGRVRLQMQNDFRNLWCATYEDKTLWISQSLESLGFFSTSFDKYPVTFYRPHASSYIAFSDRINLKCEIVEQCLSVKFEGEIARFPFPSTNFLFIQASNASGNTMLVLHQNDNAIQFLWGELGLVNSVSFEKTRQFDEWK